MSGVSGKGFSCASTFAYGTERALVLAVDKLMSAVSLQN